VPAAVVALGFGWRAARTDRGRKLRFAVGIGIATVALAAMGPRIVETVRRWDAVHFAPHAVREGGLLAATFGGHRPVDLLDLILLLSPLALVILLLPWFLTRGTSEDSAREATGRELAVLGSLVLPLLLVMPFIHPAQGLFRDWDDFAATGVAVSLLAAWSVAQVLRAAPRHAWLAVAITLSAIVPVLQWLVHHTDVERGLTRVRAFLLEPPRRGDAERGSTWDFVGIWSFRLGNDRLDAGDAAGAERRWSEAAAAWEQASATAPSPRILQQWAIAETMTGNQRFAGADRAAATLHYRKAAVIYRRMLDKDSGNALGWLGLATVSLNGHEFAEARRAANELLRLQPGNADALRVLGEVERLEAQSPAAP
jgi:hypothetical protein